MRTASLQEPFRRHVAKPIVTVQDLPYPANTVFDAAAAAIDVPARLQDHRV